VPASVIAASLYERFDSPRLGIPWPLAEVYADHLDWHQVARLVQRGCPSRLALRIVG
jgi:hypothetical protein